MMESRMSIATPLKAMGYRLAAEGVEAASTARCQEVVASAHCCCLLTATRRAHYHVLHVEECED
jgi:hypothetical protein